MHHRLTVLLLHVLLALALALTLPGIALAAGGRDYAYDVAGRLSRVLDEDGTVVTYEYDAVGNIVKISRDKVDPDFTVLGTSPESAGAGDLVTIQGRGFDPELSGNKVRIGEIEATVVSVDERGKTLVVRVPWGAETGPLVLEVGGETIVAVEEFTVIQYGDVGLRGSLAPGDTASHPLELETGQTVLVRLADGSRNAFHPTVVVRDPTGRQVASAAGADVAALSYAATVPGTFEIGVSDGSGRAVNAEYVLYYSVAPGSNEGGLLQTTDPIDGTIDLGDLDSYTFESAAGETIQLRVADVGQTSFTPYIAVYGPAGNLIEGAYGANVAAHGFRTTVAGTYTVVVFDYSSGYASTGTYKLYFARAPGSNEGGTLDPTTPRDGTIDLGDLDSYTFEVEAGVTTLLRVADVAQTSFQPYLAVYDPNGALVEGNYGANVAASGFRASIAGRYTAIVFDYSSGYASTGTYKLYFARGPGSNEHGALDPNTPIDGTIDLGDLDSYTFEVQAGVTALLRVTDVAQTSFQPYLAVYDPNGALVEGNYGANVAASGFRASIAGRYTVIVFDYSTGYASTGTYKIYFAKGPGSNERGALDPNDPVDGTIDLGDLDSYTFQAAAGVGVQLRVADVGQTAFHPYLAVYDPNGALVEGASGASVAASGFRATMAGTYTVIVFDYSTGYASTGTYELYFSRGPGSDEGGALDPDLPIDGTIDLGDLDSYTFDVTSGVGVQLRVADMDQSSFHPYLVVYDPNGLAVATVSGANVAAASFTPTVAGTYTAVVFDYSNGYASTGDYRIYFARAPGSTESGALDANAPLEGVIDLGDLDAYTFDGLSGFGVQIRVTDAGQTAFYPRVVVYDPNGVVVAAEQGADVAAASFTPSISGRYTTVVFDNSSGNASTGAYKIYFTQALGSNESGALDPNVPIDGTIDRGDLDSYTFDATAGTGVQIRVTDVAKTTLYPRAVVYDPNGAVAAAEQGAEVAAISFTPAISGRYTTVVFDNSSGNASTGAYKIYFTRAPGSNEGGSLDPNTPIDGAVDLGDLDSYTFEVASGAGVQIRVTDVAQTSLYPRVVVYDPNGRLAAAEQGADVAAVAFTPTLSGRYTAVVFDNSSGNASTGAYKIYFTRAPGSNEGGSLDPNAPIDGTIDLGDLAPFTFDLSAGAGVQIRVTDVAKTAFYPRVVVYDPSGQVVVAEQGADVAAASFNASVSGTYTAVVFDNSSGNASTGAYKIYFMRVPGSNEGVLAPAAPVTGTIDPGDLDTFTFTAGAGSRFQVTVTDVTSTAFHPRVVIYGPTGAVVTQAAGANGATATFTAAAAGTHTALVYDASSTFSLSGEYSLSLTPN